MTTGKKLTNSAVSFICGDGLYWDSELKGFGLRISGQTKSYIVQARINGASKRLTIGKHGVFTPEEARKKARQLLAQMASGVDPKEERRARKLQGTTLAQAFEDFLAARKNLKPRTIYDYRRHLATYFADWRDRPIKAISASMVESKHAEIGKRSEAQANGAMRFLRALLNFAAGKYELQNGEPLITYNPVRKLSTTRAWYRVARRTNYIEAHEFKDWHRAVIALKNDHTSDKRETVRDYLLFLAFTGLRRTEAARLHWSCVDFVAKSFTVTDTKNGSDHTLPMSDYVLALLQRRSKESGDYVFSGDGKEGYIVEPRKQMQRVSDASGVSFTLHDLRRTFATYADTIIDKDSTVKRLLNHKTGNQDVTEGYKQGIERLREPLQRLTDYMLKLAGERDSAPVLELAEIRRA